MKSKILCSILMLVSLNSCAMGSRSPNLKKLQVIRDPKSSAWFPCKNEPGFLCSTYCPMGELKNDGRCKKKLVTRKVNFCTVKGSDFFEGFIFINQSDL